MDQDCDLELRLGINISSGTTTRTEDLNYAPPTPVQMPPLQLNMFPLTSLLPPASGSFAVTPASGTLPWKKTSPGIDGGSDDERSAGEAKAAIHRVTVAKRFNVKKFLALRHHNEEAAAINVSSSNSTVDTRATQELENERVSSRVLSDAEEEGSSRKKTSPGIDGRSDDERLAGKAKAAIHRVPVAKRFNFKKFLSPSDHNKEAAAINVSSSNSTVDTSATQELENERVSSRVLSDVEEEGSSRKKPRLSEEQYALLEESFSKNRLPTHNQKQALARELNLPTHQVEVWFQNKRSRTKFNQIEIDYKLLKTCNQSLIAENIKLQKELHELRSMKLASPLMPTATITMCPCCQRITAANNSRPLALATPEFTFMSHLSPH